MTARGTAIARWLARLAAVACGYGLMAAWAWASADGMIFHPSMASGRRPAESMSIPSPDGGAIGAVHLPNPKARHTVWFFYGNAESLGDVEPLLHEFHRRGFAVFAIDYPGYGLSTGAPSEKSIYAATRAAAVHLRDGLGVPLASVIAVGRSLGGGPAVELAATERLAGLVLQSTFLSAFRVVTRWPVLPFDRFRNLAKLPRVSCPVLVIHGTADEVIPLAHGKTLHARARPPKSSLWVERAGHNNLLEVAGEPYWTALREFAANLPPRP